MEKCRGWLCCRRHRYNGGMTATPAQEKIRAFLVEKLIRDEDLDLAVDEPIFSSGLLDSFSVIQLMRFLEDEFKVRIDAADVTLPDFDSVAKIEQLVAKLRARA